MKYSENESPAPMEYFLQTLTKIVKFPPEDIKCLPLEGDASDRKYYRLKWNDHENAISSLILMELTCSTIRNEIPFVVTLNFLLEYGINVPKLYYIDKDKGFIFLEDLGDVTLEEGLEASDLKNQENYYKKSIDIVLDMQIKCTERVNKKIPAYHLAFDFKKLMWELDFMITHFIEGFLKAKLAQNDKNLLHKEFGKICAILSEQKRYFCHRDFHSRNIMIDNNKLILLDFQDAMMGPCQYDLASLLRDSYFKLNPGLLDLLLEYYINMKEDKEQTSVNREDFTRIFDLMSIQRNLKALGTFGYQVGVKRNEKFKEPIPRTLEYIYSNLCKYDDLQRLKNCLQMLYNIR